MLRPFLFVIAALLNSYRHNRYFVIIVMIVPGPLYLDRFFYEMYTGILLVLFNLDNLLIALVRPFCEIRSYVAPRKSGTF